MELTKEYFEEYLNKTLDEKLEQKLEEKLEQKLEFKLEQKLDQKLGQFATRDELGQKLGQFATREELDDKLKAQTSELKSFVMESFETQQIYIEERFQEVLGGLNIVNKLYQHEKWMKLAGKKIGIQF